MACLAGTDLLPGLVVQPIAIAVDMKRILSVGPFCVLEKLYQVAWSTAGLDSSMSPFLISGDRCIATQTSLEVPGDCYWMSGKARSTRFSMGHCCVFHNS